MAFQGISTGTNPNDGTGDTLISGARKINDNFQEIYDALGDGTNLLTGSPNLTVGFITATGGSFSGITSFSSDVAISGTVTASTFSGNLATTDLTGTITNAQLAGSIQNSKLANDSVSFGGISLDLGQTDATPAFNLSDATNYPYSSLTGISTDILGDTTPQLGGNLDINSNNITGTGNINITGLVTGTSHYGSGIGLTGMVDVADGTYGSESAALQITVVDGRITNVTTDTMTTGVSDIAEIIIHEDDVSVGTAGTINFGNNLSATPVFLGVTTVSLDSLPTTDLTGTITNAQLAGSIANAKLANSTISGVSLGSNLAELTPGNFITGTEYDGSTARTFAVDATSANTASKIVARDASGDFSAGEITATNFVIDGQSTSLVIGSNTTLYVSTTGNDSTGDGSSGSPWATIGKASEYLSVRRIKKDVVVTVELAAGTYTYTSTDRLDHPQGNQIKYVGASPVGTKPRGTTLNGDGNRGYTVTSENHNDVRLQAYYQTILQFNSTTGILIGSNSTVVLEDILIRGNYTSDGSNTTDGIRLQGGITGGLGGSVKLNNCAIHNFRNRGLALVFGGNATLTDLTITNCGGGISNSSGIILGDLSTLSGSPTLTVSNCNSDGVSILRSGTSRIQNAMISNNNGSGIDINENGSCRASGSTISNNGKKGALVQQSSSLQIRNTAVTNNGQTGLIATGNSYIDFRDVGGTTTLTGNGTPSSPFLNTTGNSGGFIVN